MPRANSSFADNPTLSNEFVTLAPLTLAHHDDLVEAVRDDDLWQTWYTHIPSPETMAAAIKHRSARHAAGEIASWAVVEASSGKAVGMTTFLHLDPSNRRLEIGSTWLGKRAQSTDINPATKLLLLERAFDRLGCIAVEFRAHWHNHQSRAAIAKLGAKQDGVLRSHVLFDNGTVRDTVVFSILQSEWPTVRFGLGERLAHRT